MPTHLETLIDQSADQNRFHSTSRYHGLPILKITGHDQRETAYVARRIIPEETGESRTHILSEGERPDHLAHHYLGDSERYWDLCDRNRTLRPWTLTAVPGDAIYVPVDGAANGSTPAFFAI